MGGPGRRAAAPPDDHISREDEEEQREVPRGRVHRDHEPTRHLAADPVQDGVEAEHRQHRAAGGAGGEQRRLRPVAPHQEDGVDQQEQAQRERPEQREDGEHGGDGVVGLRTAGGHTEPGGRDREAEQDRGGEPVRGQHGMHEAARGEHRRGKVLRVLRHVPHHSALPPAGPLDPTPPACRRLRVPGPRSAADPVRTAADILADRPGRAAGGRRLPPSTETDSRGTARRPEAAYARRAEPAYARRPGQMRQERSASATA